MTRGTWAYYLAEAIRALITDTVTTCLEGMRKLAEAIHRYDSKLKSICSEYCKLKCRDTADRTPNCYDECYRDCTTVNL